MTDTSPPPHNPRPLATSLPDPLPVTDIRCGDCGDAMELTVGSWGLYWRCVAHTTGCKGHIGAHQHDGSPLGIPANAETRAARQRVHAAFDPLWKYGDDGRKTRRRRAYAWLALALGLDGEAHISDFDLATCTRVLDLLSRVKPHDMDDPRVSERLERDRHNR